MKPARYPCFGALLAWIAWLALVTGCSQPTSPTPKSLTPLPSTLTLPPVISPSQLVWAGGQRCPIVATENNPYGGLAWEPVSQSFFTIGRLNQNILRISNVIAAGSNPLTLPRAALVKAYPATTSGFTDVYGGLRICSPDNGKPITEGLFWDRSSAVLWCTYGGNYAVSPIKDPCLVGVQFLASGGTRAFGPYTFTQPSQQGREWAYRLPVAFATAYTGGRQLCLGAGVTSGAAAASFGPNVLAVDTPGIGHTNPAVVGSAALVSYPQSNRLQRPADYTAWKGAPGVARSFVAAPQGTDQFGAIVNGIGHWNSTDSVRAACCVDLPDCQGILFFVSQSYGNVWYGNATETTNTGLTLKAGCGAAKGQTGQYYRDMVYIYSLADLVPVAAGQQTADQVQPRYTFSLSADYPGLKWNCWHTITGAVFRPDQRDIVVIAQGAEELSPGSANPILYRFAIE